MIVVFGAEGFIGTYLVSQLINEGHSVLAVGLDELGEAYYGGQGIAFKRLNIVEEKQFTRLPQQGISCAVNLACLQPANVKKEKYNPADYIKVNTLGTLNILEYCRKSGVGKVIYTISHRSVQGLWEQGKVIHEDDVKAIKFTGNFAMYSISESAAVDCVEHYRQQYGLQGIILRLPPVYGYGPHMEGFRDGKPEKTGFQVFIEKALRGETIELWGDCNKGRDIIYVKDVISAIILAMKSDTAGGLYNIASGKALSLKEEAEAIVRAFSPVDSPSQIVLRPDKQNCIDPFVYDVSKAGRDLGWYPRFSISDMLEDYKREMQSGRFNFLIEKRKRIMTESSESTL